MSEWEEVDEYCKAFWDTYLKFNRGCSYFIKTRRKSLAVASTIKGRLTMAGISQSELALSRGVSQGSISEWLNGLRPMPEGMEARIHAGLDRLEAAERTANEEADQVTELVKELTSGGAWIDQAGQERSITHDDVLIIALYNAQVFKIQERLPEA